MPHWLGYAAPIALALYLAVYPAIAAGLAWKFASARAVGNATAHPDARFALVAGAAWIATEYLRATMFTGYAWDPLGVIWVAVPPIARAARSEEHTSELQSLMRISYAVFCLKKKKSNNMNQNSTD